MATEDSTRLQSPSCFVVFIITSSIFFIAIIIIFLTVTRNPTGVDGIGQLQFVNIAT